MTYQPRRESAPTSDAARNPRQCAAHGCKVRASVSLGGAPFACSFHAFAPSQDWGRISRRMSELDWLLELIDTLTQMDQDSQDWRGFALQFWSNDPPCAPVEGEGAAPYLLRMRDEVCYRMGLVKTRPTPRLPADLQTRGQRRASFPLPDYLEAA